MGLRLTHFTKIHVVCALGGARADKSACAAQAGFVSRAAFGQSEPRATSDRKSPIIIAGPLFR
jgi:hypothetical protein